MTFSCTDQMGRTCNLPAKPRRIVSLVPSQTELLYSLGLDLETVGITKFCVHPSEWLQRKTIVGGTKVFRFDVIEELRPDLILGNKEENYKEGIEQLSSRYPLWMSDIVTLTDALHMIREIGSITDKNAEAVRLMQSIQAEFSVMKKNKTARVLYLIWRNPWMAAGPGTFIHSMLEHIGWINVLEKDRYPTLTNEELKQLNPEILLLSSEPYPFKEMHIAELREQLPASKIILVDGEMFTWYGSRLVNAPAYFQSLSI